jgi:hypothetical protein
MGIVYPAHLTLFYGYCVSFAGMDLLQGEKIYETIFKFKETLPPSPTFEQYDIQDMNFFMNSGSMLIILALIVVNFIVTTGAIWIAKKSFRFRICRKMGIKA